MSVQMIVQFNKLDGIWSGLVDSAAEKTKKEAGDQVFASFTIGKYEFVDHQFVSIGLKLTTGKQATILIPRDKIVMIIDGDDPETVGFGLLR